MLAALWRNSNPSASALAGQVRFLRWAPSVTTPEPVRKNGVYTPEAGKRAPADWAIARRVSPRYIVQQYEKKAVRKRVNGRVLEKFQVGDTISMKYRQSLRDPKEKPILIEGVVVAIRNRGLGSSFTIVNKFAEHTVERTYPMYSPFIKSIMVLQSRDVVRAKPYYLKNLIDRT